MPPILIYTMFFDIGAHVGRWSLDNLSNASKIISVEADPQTFGSLVATCRGKTNIICENYAVCDNSGADITFYRSTSTSVISTINRNWLTDPSSRFNNYPFEEIKCKTITIDSLIEKYGIPELIKIDVEGGEFQCIRSLTQKVKHLCFEWASETNEITIKCLDYLQALGFTRFFLQQGDFYTFRPSSYTTIEAVKEELSRTTPKNEWGMMWCM
jgi:FkbM family methyltransferase